MPVPSRCPRCRGERTQAMVAVGRGETLYAVRSDGNFTQPLAYTGISAWVCTDCGHTELYADAPLALARPHEPENVREPVSFFRDLLPQT